MICAGIDGGSRTVKIVLMDSCDLRVAASGAIDQGVDHDGLTHGLFDRLTAEAGLSRDDVARVVATGYTRNAVTLAGTTFTEVTCHAVGVRHLVPDAATIIEMGGQDSKLLHLDERGAVRDFAMNDRCAAGTGRFLEVVAARLETRLDALGGLAARSSSPAPISSMCVVFAETEIIGLLSGGADPAEIVAGVQRSIAGRVASMASRGVAEPVVFTGGVALVSGMTGALSEALGCAVEVAPEPQMTGALGAAILACRGERRGRG
jgi:predicted CoA-substrate-specific enzyme activase